MGGPNARLVGVLFVVPCEARCGALERVGSGGLAGWGEGIADRGLGCMYGVCMVVCMSVCVGLG